MGLAIAVGVMGCEKPTALVFAIDAPPNPLLDPFQGNVSDYLLTDDTGATLAAVSAGASRDSQGRLALGPLSKTLTGDLRLDLLSGTELVGRALVTDVGITTGKTEELEAAVRKPLVVVGSAAAPEAAGTIQPGQLLDVTTDTDLAKRGVVTPIGTASAFSDDGRYLVVTGQSGLTVIDTGTGTNAGPATLPFTPQAISIARDDQALAVAERSAARARVLIYTDVAALLAAPKSAQPVTATLATSDLVRTAHFSADGKTLYVLVEDASAEPCTGTTAPAANSIIPVDTTGTVGDAIAMPSYVADFAVDASNRLILSEAGGNQIAILDLSADGQSATGAPQKLYAATCPTAVRVLDQQVFAVTNDGSMANFSLLSGHLDGSTATMLPIPRPEYVTPLTGGTSTQDGLTSLSLGITSFALAATEMAISPDASRAVIATRARETETGSSTFMFATAVCTATTDIVEYGFYSVDLVAGTASYVARSQNTIVPADPDTTACVTCTATLQGLPPTMLEIELFCPSVPGDRAAGLAAAFSGAP